MSSSADGSPPGKRARLGGEVTPDASRVPAPGELEEGTLVIYWGKRHGLVRDAFVPLDEFWVADIETGKILRDEKGDIIQFRSADLRLPDDAAAAAAAAAASPGRAAAGGAVPGCAEALPATRSGVLLLACEEHAVKLLEQFGPARTHRRCDPQQLLAIPCHMCLQDKLAGVVAEGLAPEVLELARGLRPDVQVGLRLLQLTEALQLAGLEELSRLGGFYLLACVQVPYPLNALSTLSPQERLRGGFCSQVEVCITASAECQGADASDAARRVLGEALCVDVLESIWSDQAQAEVRRQLGVPELATEFRDSMGTDVKVLLLPKDASISTVRGALRFGVKGVGGSGDEGAGFWNPGDEEEEGIVQGKTAREWEAEQKAEFAGCPKLPVGWLCVRARSTGEVYFFNKRTLTSTFEAPEAPLPPGWTKQLSKTTGRVYYFHLAKRLSTFERPSEED